MDIPSKVIRAAQYLVEMYGDHLEHLGTYRGAEAFYYRFPDDVTAGFPPVYLIKDDKLKEVGGFEALEIIGLFVENFSESDVK
jgi:hypothetical protein